MFSKAELIEYVIRENHYIPGHNDLHIQKAVRCILDSETSMGHIGDEYFTYDMTDDGVIVTLGQGAERITRMVSWAILYTSTSNPLSFAKSLMWKTREALYGE